MKSQIIRINCNHFPISNAHDYLNVCHALRRSVILTFTTIDRVIYPLHNIVFEDDGLQRLWETDTSVLNHEHLVQQLGLAHYREMFEHLHEVLEAFLRKHHHPYTTSTFVVGVCLDLSMHLCIHLRRF